jgi:CHC2 zinc finger
MSRPSGDRSVLLDENLFGRHLELAPLRGRRLGLVRCVFHTPDRRGSLSIDLDRGLFHCFTCGAGGGLVRFAELVGERVARSAPQLTHESPLQQARRQILRIARAQDARRAEWLPLWHVSDHIRLCARLVREARQWATQLGPDDPRTWPLLERAAAVEREGLSVEAELDSILADGRVA